jgi:ketosteroid isomerase-like protein
MHDKKNSGEISMTVTPERIREIFKSLENSDAASFFERVADNVDWTVMGTHPLAGHYDSKKAFIEGTFAKLGQVLPKEAQLLDSMADRMEGKSTGDKAALETSVDDLEQVIRRNGFKPAARSIRCAASCLANSVSQNRKAA